MESKIGGSLLIFPTANKMDIEFEVDILKSAGYDYAEIGLGLSIEPLNLFKDKLKTLRNIIPIYSAHLPGCYNKEEREICKKYIEILSDKGIKLFIIHLYAQNLPTNENLEFKIKSLQDLADFVKRKDSTIALENTEEDIMTLKKVFDQIPKIDFCLDIGHANLVPIGSNSVDLINQFGKLLKHIHMHDNIGGNSEKHDIHLPIGEGNINFKPIFERLQEINYSGNITIELFKPDFETRKLSIKRLKEFLG